MFDVMQKSSKFLLEIMTLVSSANIMGSVKENCWRKVFSVYYEKQGP
jgi:hypothetical protein